MATLIGGFTPGYLEVNNQIIGTVDADNIFGDPYTEGNFEGLTEPGGVLSSGRGGNDHLDGAGGSDTIVGDAGQINGTGRGGNDIIDGGDGDEGFLMIDLTGFAGITGFGSLSPDQRRPRSAPTR